MEKRNHDVGIAAEAAGNTNSTMDLVIKRRHYTELAEEEISFDLNAEIVAVAEVVDTLVAVVDIGAEIVEAGVVFRMGLKY